MSVRIDRMWCLGALALLGSLAGIGCGAADVVEGEQVAESEENLDIGRFGGWQAVLPAGTFTSSPALLNIDGNLNAIEVYGKGQDNAVWYANRSSPTSAWTGWFTIGGVATSKPSVTMFRTDRRAVAVKGSDHRIWVNVTLGGTSGFQGFQAIGADVFSTGPAVTYLSPYLFVVARKSNKKLYWTRNDVSAGLNSNNWSAWAEIPNFLSESEPSLTRDSVRIMVGARGIENGAWINGTSNFGDTWNTWRRVGQGVIRDAPAVAWHTSSAGIEVSGRGTDDFMWVATANAATGATTGWSQIPGQTFVGGPGVAANGSSAGRFGIVGRRSDGTLSLNLWE
jgi:sialidase-1